MAIGCAVLLDILTEQDSQEGPGRGQAARSSHQTEYSFLSAQPFCFWMDQQGRDQPVEEHCAWGLPLVKSSCQQSIPSPAPGLFTAKCKDLPSLTTQQERGGSGGSGQTEGSGEGRDREKQPVKQGGSRQGALYLIN